MACNRPNGLLHRIRTLVAGRTTDTSDRELLERFIRQRDEGAFAALLERHGAMVHGVCRRLLRHAQDAEDACQATFLILARKAPSLRKANSLGSWLHGVAYRVAADLKRRLNRRTAREQPIADVCGHDDTDVTWRQVRAALGEELRALPERLRVPLVLCYLEGRTRDEAAAELGWRLSTL